MIYRLYLRVSTEEQDLRTQLSMCLQFITKLHGNDSFKYEVYTDSITSRCALEKRMGMQKCLSELKKGDVVIGLRVDRLARNAYEAHCIQHIVMTKGANILMVEQPGITNAVIFGMYAGFAEEEGKLIRARIKEKLDAKGERNERRSRHLPYGYQMHTSALVQTREGRGKTVMKLGLLIEEPVEQQVIAHMCALFDEGMNFRNIVQTLKDQGYKNRQGTPFQLSYLHRILSRTGRTRCKDQPQEDLALLACH